MVLIIHGGPFGQAPRDMFLGLRALLLMQGYTLLVVHYRGSIGYGEDFMNELIGNIGKNDVEDCGELVKATLKKHSNLVNSKKVVSYGASHGGYLTGMLIGNLQYKDLFNCAVLWNPCINFNSMAASTDIPDWVTACILGKKHDYKLTEEENNLIYQASPISLVQNVNTPSLFLIGGKDLRVPPH